MTYEARFRIIAALFIVALVAPAALGQQSLIVPAKGGTVSVLDLETLNLKQTLNVTGLPAIGAVIDITVMLSGVMSKDWPSGVMVISV